MGRIKKPKYPCIIMHLFVYAVFLFINGIHSASKYSTCAHVYMNQIYKHIIYQSHIYIWYIYIYNKYYVIKIERNRWVITVLYCTSLLYSSVTYLFRSNKEPPWTLVFQSKPSLPYGSSAMPCSCLRMWLVCVAGGYGFSGTGPLELPWGKQMGHAAHLSWV